MNLLASTILTTLTMFSFYSKSNAQVVSSLYEVDINLKSLEGQKIVFSKFKGKKVLFVNVASKCGFTPQYKDLQELHNQYKDKLVIIGAPCNQFGKQEPGSSDEIATFCQKNYGVEFLMTEKIDVKGDGQHELYKWLTDKSANGKVDASVKWNFQKYLIDENGKMVDYFMSSTKPLSSKITSLL
jgi:glutathione peroxidase